MLISRLPAASALWEAQANDPEYARWAVSQPSVEASPRLSEYSTSVELLAAIFDRLGELTRVTVASAGGKPGEVRPWPRPMTEIERAQRQARMDRHEALVTEIMGRGETTGA